jgi:glucosamine--fructose-6-phosphate aminotransferase (isomerizing)
MSHMLDEIRQQPEIVRTIINTQFKNVEALSSAITARGIRFAYIAARGTSDNVATYAKYLLEIEHSIPTALAAPAVFTIYEAVPNFGPNALVIGISQSGEAPDVIAVVDRARQTGALTVAITNTASSTLAGVAEYALVTPAGVEQSIAATKTYTSALAMIALLSTALTPNQPNRLEHLRRSADLMDRSLRVDDVMQELVARYKDMEGCVVVGRGYNHCTALEIALKLTECCYVAARAFSAADFQHGPMAQLHEGYPVLLVAPDGKAYETMVDLTHKLKDRHPAIIAFAHNCDFLTGTETAIRIPGTVPEWLSPLVYGVAGQLFAYWLAIASDHDPDHPRGLSKLTQTT